MIVDVDIEPDLSDVLWVCHGCHRRYDQEQACCPGELVLRHDISQPCEDCAMPEVVEE